MSLVQGIAAAEARADANQASNFVPSSSPSCVTLPPSLPGGGRSGSQSTDPSLLMVGLRSKQTTGHCISYTVLVASYTGILRDGLLTSEQAETCTESNVAGLFLCFRAQGGKDNLLV